MQMCRYRQELFFVDRMRLGYTILTMAFRSTFPSLQLAANRRMPGVAITIALRLALLLAWKMVHAPGPVEAKDSRSFMQWIALPAPAAPRPREVLPAAQKAPVARAAPARSTAVAVPRPVTPASTPTPAKAAVAPPSMSLVAPSPPADPAETVMEKARRSAGAVDRALRKANNPYIVAPLDSPEMRMRRGMEEAHALAAPRLWEAPKIEELVNQTGGGTQRDRVIGGLGTYCRPTGPPRPALTPSNATASCASLRASNTKPPLTAKHGAPRATSIVCASAASRQRNGLKNARISWGSKAGVSSAAKWPPRGMLVHRCTSKQRAAHDCGGIGNSRG